MCWDPSADNGPFDSQDDRERGSARMRSKLKRLLERPPDPAALQRIRREKGELSALATRDINTLSGQQAWQLIRGRNLLYTDAPAYFELWWRSVDADTQQQINVAAEDFEELQDYWWKSMEGPVLNATQATLGLKTIYAQLQQQLPKISEPEFGRLWLAAERRGTIKKRGKQRSVVKTFVDEYVAATRQLLYNTFSIVPHRPPVEQVRDRQFSKLDYQGSRHGEIARDWNRLHRNERRAVTAAGVRKAIQRYRKKRAPVMWLLRLWIYSSRVPSLPSPHLRPEAFRR
jgi:hypothetical protein